FFFFFFNDTATTEIYTLSLHDALPISTIFRRVLCRPEVRTPRTYCRSHSTRSEEHTSELQSLTNLVCRLLPLKKTWALPIRFEKKPSRPQSLTHLLIRLS